MASISASAIRADFESRIATGSLRTGDQLPSVRTLADELGVSPTTVAAAYRELRLRGLVQGRGRQGTRVAPARRFQINAQPTVPEGLVDAVNGSPDPNLLPDLGPALRHAASQPQPAYGGELVEPSLARAARTLFERDGIDGSAMTVTSGAMDAVERVINALDLRIGDRIGVEDPGHIPVHQLARTAGLELVPLPVDEHGITPAGLAAALDARLSAVVVTPRAHNPTGAAFTADRAEQLSALLEPHPATALIQDDHAGLISGVDYHPIRAPGPRWATMRSLGKSFGPDVRVALVAGDHHTMSRVTTGLSNGPGWVSFILQRVAAFLLDDPDTARLLTHAATSYARRRTRLIDALADYGVAGSAASGINVWIPTTRDEASIEAARGAGYAIRSGSAYVLTNQRAVRVTISMLDDHDIDAIADAIGRAHHARSVAAAM